MKSLISIFILIFGIIVSAQEQDSLFQALETTTNPTEKAKIYLRLVNYFAESDSTKAMHFIESAQDLTSTSDKVGLADIQNSLGFFYMTKDPERSKQHFEKGIALVENENSDKALNLNAKLHYNIAAHAQRNNQLQLAIDYLLNQSIPAAQKAPNKLYLSNNYLMLGLIFYNDNNLDKSISYHHMAEDQLMKLEPNKDIRKYLILVKIYLAEAYLKDEQYPHAKTSLDQAKSMLDKYPNDDIKGEWYHLMSIYYNHTDQPEKALPIVNEGLAFSQGIQNMYQMVRLKFMKSKILGSLGKYDESKQMLLDLMQDEMYVKIYGRNISLIYEDLSLLEEERGNYQEALQFARKRMAFSDSLNLSEQNRIINEMEVKYRTEENQKELAINKLKLNEKNQYMWIFLISSLVFLGSALFTFFYFKNKKKLAEQREINWKQKLIEKEQKEELNLTKAILDGEERERQRVAKDLHDGLGGMLAGVKINLSTWSNNYLEENQIESFNRILNQLDSSVSELRRVARNLMPESLLNFGLEIALKDLCEFYQQPNLTIDFQPLNIQPNLPLNLQINIYRIVQELLANAVKHAHASNILVQCSQSHGQFYITVEDNGKGILKSEEKKLNSMGLNNLKNRVHFLKGNLDIHSIQDQGTTINIELNTHAA